MKKIYKILIWLPVIVIFGLFYLFSGFNILILNLILLNIIVYFARLVLIDIFRRLKNLLTRYILVIIVNIIWLIFPFLLLFIISPILFIAVISFLIVAISLTFQNIINNIASGIMLLSSEGFEVGDLIDTNGVVGIVKEITLNHITLQDFDGSKTFVPNKNAFNSTVVRHTHKPVKVMEKINISELFKKFSKIITGEKKLTRYIKVIELLNTVDFQKLEEKLNPVLEKYKEIFGFKPYFYANNTVQGVAPRLSITLNILTNDPKLILRYSDAFLKDIFMQIYYKTYSNENNSRIKEDS